MPTKPARRPQANSPVTLAEEVMAKLDKVPWPLTAFIGLGKGERVELVTLKPDHPETGRVIAIGKLVMVGTYNRSARMDRLTEDITCAMGEL